MSKYRKNASAVWALSGRAFILIGVYWWPGIGKAVKTYKDYKFKLVCSVCYIIQGGEVSMDELYSPTIVGWSSATVHPIAEIPLYA